MPAISRIDCYFIWLSHKEAQRKRPSLASLDAEELLLNCYVSGIDQTLEISEAQECVKSLA